MYPTQSARGLDHTPQDNDKTGPLQGGTILNTTRGPLKHAQFFRPWEIGTESSSRKNPDIEPFHCFMNEQTGNGLSQSILNTSVNVEMARSSSFRSRPTSQISVKRGQSSANRLTGEGVWSELAQYRGNEWVNILPTSTTEDARRLHVLPSRKQPSQPTPDVVQSCYYRPPGYASRDVCNQRPPIGRQERIRNIQRVEDNSSRQDDAKASCTKKCFTRQAVQLMDDWYQQNFDHPYPDKATANRLADLGGVTVPQVRKWMANKRVRSFNTLSFNGAVHPRKLQRIHREHAALTDQLQRLVTSKQLAYSGL